MRNTLLLFCFLLTPQLFFAQSHTFETLFVELSGNATDGDFSNNTYYYAYDSCDVSWQIIRDSIPLGWQYSFCFPNCYEPGITSGNSLFLSNTEQFLNCHIYPNNIPGAGLIEMEITTNSLEKDTVLWSATAIDNLYLSDPTNNFQQKILNIYNLEGRVLSKPNMNQIILIEYENGSIQKKVILNQ